MRDPPSGRSVERMPQSRRARPSRIPHLPCSVWRPSATGLHEEGNQTEPRSPIRRTTAQRTSDRIAARNPKARSELNVRGHCTDLRRCRSSERNIAHVIYAMDRDHVQPSIVRRHCLDYRLECCGKTSVATMLCARAHRSRTGRRTARWRRDGSSHFPRSRFQPGRP